MVERNAEDRRSRENEWPVVAMAPLHQDKDHNSGERALFLTVAELKQLLDANGRLVIALTDVESYSEADGLIIDAVKGACSVLQSEDPRTASDN